MEARRDKRECESIVEGLRPKQLLGCGKAQPTRFLRAMQYTPVALQRSRNGVPSFEICTKADHFSVLTGRNVKNEVCRKILGVAPKPGPVYIWNPSSACHM